MTKIRNKLLLALLLVSLLPALFIGAAAIWSNTSQLKANAIHAQRDHVALISERIERQLDIIKSDVLYLRETNALKLYLSGQNNPSSRAQQLLQVNLRNSLKQFSEQKQYYHSIIFVDKAGEEVIKIKQEDGKHKAVSSTNLGKVKQLDSFNNALALDDGSLDISDIMPALNDNGSTAKPAKPVMYYSARVSDHEQRPLGVIILTLDASIITDIIKRDHVQNTQMFLIDSKHFYIYHDQAEKMWGQAQYFNTQHTLDKDYPELGSKINQQQGSHPVELKDHIATYSAINVRDNKKPISLVVSVTSNQSLLRSIDNFIYVFLGIILITLLATFMVALILSNSFTKPIIELTKSVNELSKGELEQSIHSDTKDEINELSQSIERLRKSMNILMRRASAE